MKELFEKIKQVVPDAIYMHNGIGGCIPCPSDIDTASMVFIEVGGYTVGFLTELKDEERALVENILLYGTEKPSSDQLRRTEYDRQGVTFDEMVVALWEAYIEQRPEKAAQLQAVREDVKADIAADMNDTEVKPK
jgi:hypothetical protein